MNKIFRSAPGGPRRPPAGPQESPKRTQEAPNDAPRGFTTASPPRGFPEASPETRPGVQRLQTNNPGTLAGGYQERHTCVRGTMVPPLCPPP
eukprot:2118194-Pyramimonas_sp.AAC.1